MERHRIACAVWLAIGCTLAAAGARAQDEARFALEWSAPEGCPDARAIEGEILRLAGHEPATPMRVRATITRDGERFRIELATSSAEGEGTRTIEGASCESIAEAGVLVIAMAIDPDAALRASNDPVPVPETGTGSGSGTGTESGTASATATASGTESGTATETATAPGAVVTDSRATVAPGERAAPAVSFVAAAHATIGVGPLPSASPGAALALGARIDPIELWVGGSFLAEQGAVVDGFGASFWQATARARACVPIALGTPIVELAPCAGVELGAIQGTPAADVPRRTTGTSIWSALELVLEARAWIIRELGVTVAAGLEIPFVIERFVVNAGGTAHVLHRPSDAAFLGAIGLVLRVP